MVQTDLICHPPALALPSVEKTAVCHHVWKEITL